MFWADRIAEEIRATRTPRDGKTFRIRDEKTLSGRVHVGSMRGVAIHGLVGEALSELGVPNTYTYELNDFDDFDSVPGYLPEEAFKEYLAYSLHKVPSPVEGYENFAEYYGAEFVEVHKKAGFFPEYYRATELYRSGKMDPQIRIALERAHDVRRILKEVSGSVKDESWLPISVVCEQCGKMKTTRAYEFDGETVGYTCDVPAYGALPCGHVGRVAPWGGASKLFWKVDWAAKWVAGGVDIEGAGKDHCTKGGSRDVADHIARELFDYEPPYNIPYEFFLVGGKKMSSSKGRGSSAKDMADLFPAEIYRLALIGKDINQQVDVDPEGESVPRLYDWHDELAQLVRDGVADDFTRLYTYTKLPEARAALTAPWMLRFSQVAFIAQMPHISMHAEAERVKGSLLTEEEKALLDERESYALYWLSTYADPQYQYRLQEHLPQELALTETQKHALGLLATFMETGPKTGEEIHEYLHALKTEAPIAPKELFGALYRVFLDRDSGPKAGWFLSVLPHEHVITMLRSASV